MTLARSSAYPLFFASPYLVWHQMMSCLDVCLKSSNGFPRTHLHVQGLGWGECRPSIHVATGTAPGSDSPAAIAASALLNNLGPRTKANALCEVQLTCCDTHQPICCCSHSPRQQQHHNCSSNVLWGIFEQAWGYSKLSQ